MPIRQLPGGANPFKTQLRPSPFNRLPVQEVIDRLGEPVVWIRMMPGPRTAPGRHPLPDDPDVGGQGAIPTVMRSIRQVETANPQFRTGNRIYTQFCPVDSVNRLRVLRREDYGGNIDLAVSGFGDEWIEYEPTADALDAFETEVDYNVRTFRESTFELTAPEVGSFLELDGHDELIRGTDGSIDNVCVGLREVRRYDSDMGEWVLVDDCRHSFTRILLPAPGPAGARYRITINVYDTFRVAYRTMEARKEYVGNLPFESGDMEVVTSPSMRMSEGDLIVFVMTRRPKKEITDRGSDGLFRLGSGPVAEIGHVVAVGDSGTEELPLSAVEVRNLRSIAIPGREDIKQVSVLYEYNPQYRIKRQLEASGLQNQLQPPVWHAVPDSTVVVI